MTVGVVDSTVIVHLFRRDPIGTHLVRFPVSSTGRYAHHMDGNHVWRSRQSRQAKCKAILSEFDMEYLTRTDMDWAMQQLERYRLSHGVETNDCLMASVCHRLQVPLYTHNLKDMRVLLDEPLVMKPY